MTQGKIVQRAKKPDPKIDFWFIEEAEDFLSWKFIINNQGNLNLTAHPINNQPLGALLFDVYGADFGNGDSFIAFAKKWGVAGLLFLYQEEHGFWGRYAGSDNLEIKEVLLDVWADISPYLIDAQAELKKLFDDCFRRDSKGRGLSPQERMHMSIKTNNFSIINKCAEQIHVTPFFYPIGTDKKVKLVEQYSSNNIFAICYMELVKMIINDVTVKHCKHCGLPFVPRKRNDAEYCERPAKPGTTKTCKEIGPIENYNKKVNKDPVLKVYRKHYKIMHQRTTARGKSRITDEFFSQWKDEAAAIIKDVRQGKKSLEEFEAWCKKNGR